MSTNSGQSSGIETASLSLSRPLKAIGRIPSSSGTFLVAGNKLGSLQCLSGFPGELKEGALSAFVKVIIIFQRLSFFGF